MFTICPGCQRQFRLYAEHIAAAAGQVRCGFCQLQFNALERLYDQPLTPEQQAAAATQKPKLEEPQFDIPEQADTDLAPAQSLAAAIPVTELPQQEQPVSSDSHGPDSADDDALVIEQSDEQDAAESGQIQVDSTDPAETKSRFQFDDEDVDLDGETDDAGRRVASLWSVGVLSVLLILAMQLAWFQRDRVLQDYPELRPYVQQLCDKLDCNVIRGRDTAAISLLNRDVRLHPAYQDTLLVNATMQNQLAVRQPYPQVQLTLYDTAGELIGYREFAPTDYLDASIDIDKGMPVTSPVHFVLEVVGSSDEAVSFEFRFL